MSIRPIGDRVLVVPDEPEMETESGLVLVQDDEPSISGTVRFIGPGPRCPTCSNRLRSDLKVGDRVAFAPNRGTEVEYDGLRLVVLNQDDVVGVEE